MKSNPCPNETEFSTRTAHDTGRKLHRCKHCGRVLRIARQHPLPGPTTESYDRVQALAWSESSPRKLRRQAEAMAEVAPEPEALADEVALCQDRFLIQELKDPDADKRMECAKRKGHPGQHRNITNDLTWSRGVKIDLREYA